MRKIKENYLAILRIELKDLQEDIETLIEQYTQEREQGKLTNYVFMENLALFKNELLGVEAFSQILDEIDLNRFATLDEMVDHLKNTFRDKVRTCGLAEVINIFIERKLEKVRQYVSQERTPPPVLAFSPTSQFRS